LGAIIWNKGFVLNVATTVAAAAFLVGNLMVWHAIILILGDKIVLQHS